MTANEAVVASLDGLAVRMGKRDEEKFYFDGREYTQHYRGYIGRADPLDVLGRVDWKPNSPSPEILSEFH